MNAQPQKRIAAVIAVLAIGVFDIAAAKADTRAAAGGLVYTDGAYIHAIPVAPAPASAGTHEYAEIIYTNTAYGPAVHSYPSNTVSQSTHFNVHYVDTSHGPAIYSYPSNGPQNRLTLSDNAGAPEQPVFFGKTALDNLVSSHADTGKQSHLLE